MLERCLLIDGKLPWQLSHIQLFMTHQLLAVTSRNHLFSSNSISYLSCRHIRPCKVRCYFLSAYIALMKWESDDSSLISTWYDKVIFSDYPWYIYVISANVYIWYSRLFRHFEAIREEFISLRYSEYVWSTLNLFQPGRWYSSGCQIWTGRLHSIVSSFKLFQDYRH